MAYKKEKLLKISKEIDELADEIKNSNNKKYFKDQISLNNSRASDIYDRSLWNTKQFFHYVRVIFKKDLIPLKKLIKKYVNVQQGLLDINEKLSDEDTQLSPMKKKLLKLELDSLYNILNCLINLNLQYILKHLRSIMF